MRRFIIAILAVVLSLPFFIQVENVYRAEKEQRKIKENKDKDTEYKTITHLMKTALQPVGQTMYTWGGGWNEEDTGSGIETRTIGLSPRWKEFFEQQGSDYNFQTTLYQIHDGLDCSGYIGWILYNVFETENEKEGYVTYSGEMIDDFVQRGWGSKISSENIDSYHCGDILANDGHIYMVIGSCSDGSVLFTHASPPGVRICGTPSKDGVVQSQAVQLAQKIMSDHYPDWYAKFPNCSVDYSYLTQYDQFRWNGTLKDVDHLADKKAEEIIEILY